jgi:hypothetical protein
VDVESPRGVSPGPGSLIATLAATGHPEARPYSQNLRRLGPDRARVGGQGAPSARPAPRPCYRCRMHRPTETALRTRARTLLEAMTARERWVYAVPRDRGIEGVRALVIAQGLRPAEPVTEGSRESFTGAAGTRLRATDRPDLDVILLEGEGSEAAAALAAILDETGFYAQSTLLGTAFDVQDEEADVALRTLAAMVAAWDKDWLDLFGLHLKAPDPALRKEAIASLLTACVAARASDKAAALLAEVRAAEKDEALAEALDGAITSLRLESP